MGRSYRIVVAIAVVSLMLSLTSCGGSGNGTTVTAEPVPASITLTPSGNNSLELGKTMLLTATPLSSGNATLTTSIHFISTNSAVVSVAASGLACAGSWDSLSNPQICTPGPVGVSQITAQAEGVTSTTATIFVHQHVDHITIGPAPSQLPLTANCVSKNQTFLMEAHAFSLGTDITSSVGPISWNVANTNTANVLTLLPGLTSSQAQLTAVLPGFTTVSASAGSANSVATPFITCPIKSIVLTANGSTNTNLSVPLGTSISAAATTTDAAGNVVTEIPLTWSSSNSASVSASGAENTAIITTPAGGGATIIASCTPPSCNSGFQPSMPVYPDNFIQVTAGTTGVTQSLTLLVTSDGCANASGCVTNIVPITTSSGATTPSNTVGTPVNLTATPNSLLFAVNSTQGSAFMGTDLSQQGTKGLMTFSSGNALAQFPSAPGKVLAVSPDGNTVIVSDTADTTNQLFLFKTAGNTSTPFSITGAAAAAFSPDSLKAFVVAGSTLYIFSTQDAMQTVSLAAPADGVSFLPQGGTAAILGGTTSGLTLWSTTDGSQVGSAIPTPTTPTFIQALPDGVTVLGVASPGIDLINTSTSAVSSFSFGRGSFTPKQLLVSGDGTRAYVLTADLPVILVFDLTTHTSTALALSGNAFPLVAALTPDGTSLYVGGSDGQVHVLDTQAGVDIQQVSFDQNFCRDTQNNSLETIVNITAASQSGTNTTYSYSLTSGPPLEPGENIQITNLANTGNNGAFIITSVASGTFTVTNSSGVTASGQNGTGTINACPPDIMAFRH